MSSRFLSLDERIRIADRLHQPGISLRMIATELGRPVSTISRELGRNQQPDGTYQPHAAHERAAERRARPKVGKLTADPALRAVVQDGLDARWSPQQITRRLRRDYPDRPEWHVSCETIYQALYVQARGGLRREVAGWLRTGRIARRSHVRPDQRRPRMATPMMMISDRPAEVADRAVPGHWEGDLIMGAHNRSAIGTLVERNTRYVMLLHLPEGYTPTLVRDALIAKIQTLPTHLRRSLTWDQGSEMHLHGQFTAATDMPVYFCDPHAPWQRGSNENTNGLLRQYFPKGTDMPVYFCDPHAPWQRGSNENTNGLLRQYFPKGTDLSAHTAEHLDTVAIELNDRPRMTLDWDTPAERMTQLLTTHNQQQCCNHP